MAKNQYSSHGEGRYITVAKASVSSGDPVIIGDEGLHGFSLIDTDGSGNIVVDTAGIYTFPVKGNNGSIDTAVAIGDAVFFTAGEAFFDVDPTAAFFGYALGAVDSGETTTIPVLVVQKSDIVSGTVTTDKIADDAVTKAKLAGGFLKQAVIDGGAAGAHTVTGIAVGDELVSVVQYDIDTGAVVDVVSLTSEFSITAADTINNTGGTVTTGDKLVVTYLDLT